RNHFSAEELVELFRRPAGRIDALLREDVLHVGKCEDLVHRDIQLRHDVARQTRRSEETVPRLEIEPFHAAFYHRRNVFHAGGALRARHTERAQLAAFDLRYGAGMRYD